MGSKICIPSWTILPRRYWGGGAKNRSCPCILIQRRKFGSNPYTTFGVILSTDPQIDRQRDRRHFIIIVVEDNLHGPSSIVITRASPAPVQHDSCRNLSRVQTRPNKRNWITAYNCRSRQTPTNLVGLLCHRSGLSSFNENPGWMLLSDLYRGFRSKINCWLWKIYCIAATGTDHQFLILMKAIAKFDDFCRRRSTHLTYI